MWRRTRVTMTPVSMYVRQQDQEEKLCVKVVSKSTVFSQEAMLPFRSLVILYYISQSSEFIAKIRGVTDALDAIDKQAEEVC
jgi:type III secretory pathway component EscR